jgi:hypothetical protein
MVVAALAETSLIAHAKTSSPTDGFRRVKDRECPLRVRTGATGFTSGQGSVIRSVAGNGLCQNGTLVSTG